MISSHPHLLFSLGENAELFALEVEHVWQVIEAETPPVRVPLAPAPVEGVINHHGRILTVIDPAPLLGLQSQGQPVAQVVLLRRSGGGHLGLKVHRTRGILSGELFEQEDLPLEPCVAAVARLDKELVHVVHLSSLMAAMLASFASPHAEHPTRNIAPR